jgi:hypothetical protein
VSRGGSRKNDLENRKTAIGAFFCTRKIRMETGLIIENGLILPSKNGFENWHFLIKNRYFLSLSDKIGVIALFETPEFKFGVAKMCDEYNEPSHDPWWLLVAEIHAVHFAEYVFSISTGICLLYVI